MFRRMADRALKDAIAAGTAPHGIVLG